MTAPERIVDHAATPAARTVLAMGRMDVRRALAGMRAAIASEAQAVKFPIGLLRAIEVRSSEFPIMPSVQRLLTEP